MAKKMFRTNFPRLIKFDVSSIRKHYKIKLLARINKGEIGLLPELEQLEKLSGEMPS